MDPEMHVKNRMILIMFDLYFYKVTKKNYGMNFSEIVYKSFSTRCSTPISYSLSFSLTLAYITIGGELISESWVFYS